MSIEAIRELETLASVCPELNMANYTEDDVRHLNDWAIEMSLLVERYTPSQQTATGAPVLFIHPDTFAMNNSRVGAWKPGHELTGYIPLYIHPAPSAPNDHQIATLVNKARDIARMFHDHQSLRERIAIELVPVLKAKKELT